MTDQFVLPEYGLRVLRFCFQKKSFAKVNVSKQTIQRELSLADETLFDSCVEVLIANGYLEEGQRGGVLITTHKGIKYIKSLELF